MGHDADIAVTLDRCCAGHASISNSPGILGTKTELPAVVRERFVGFRHTMRIFFLSSQRCRDYLQHQVIREQVGEP